MQDQVVGKETPDLSEFKLIKRTKRPTIGIKSSPKVSDPQLSLRKPRKSVEKKPLGSEPSPEDQNPDYCNSLNLDSVPQFYGKNSEHLESPVIFTKKRRPRKSKLHTESLREDSQDIPKNKNPFSKNAIGMDSKDWELPDANESEPSIR